MDVNGNKIKMFENACGFIENVALVMENGNACVINDKMEIIQEIGEADDIYKWGELFAIEKGEERVFYRIVDVV